MRGTRYSPVTTISSSFGPFQSRQTGGVDEYLTEPVCAAFMVGNRHPILVAAAPGQ